MSVGAALSSFGSVFDGYYVSNLALLASYSFARSLIAEGGRTDTSKLANKSQLVAWEKQAALMLAIVLAIKVFRRQSTAALTADLLFYAKAAAAALCYYIDFHAFVLYTFCTALAFLLFPHPPARNDGKVTLLTPAALREHVRQQREGSQAAWLVLLYASWSSPCLIFDSTFADLALLHAKPERLNFGKLEISRRGDVDARWPQSADELGVSLALGAQQLPTLMLYERGKLVKRLSAPIGSVLKGGLTAHDCMKQFQLHRF